MFLLKTLTPSVRNNCFEVWAIQPVPSEKCSKCDMCLISVTCLTQWFVAHSVECLVNAAYTCVRERWGRGEGDGEEGERTVVPSVYAVYHPCVHAEGTGGLLCVLICHPPSPSWHRVPYWLPWQPASLVSSPSSAGVTGLHEHMESDLRSLCLCDKHSHSTSSLQPQNYSINITFTWSFLCNVVT